MRLPRKLGHEVEGEIRSRGGEAAYIRADVRNESEVQAFVGKTAEKYGQLNVACNDAGYTLIGSLEETSIEEAKRLFETNFFGVLRMTQAVLRFMREQRSGRIVNIGSLVGFVPAPYQGIYCASNHSLEIQCLPSVSFAVSPESAT